MKKALAVFLTVLMVFAVSVPAFAEINLDTRGLTEEQKAKLAIQAEQMKKQAIEEVKKKITPEVVNDWVAVGKNAGLAFAAAAGELGMAADKFLESTSGKLVAVGILWTVIGSDLMGVGSSFVGIIIGIAGLIGFTILWVYFFRRMCIFKVVKIEYPEGKGMKKVKHFEYYNVKDSDVQGTRFVMFLILCLIGAVSLFVMFG